MDSLITQLQNSGHKVTELHLDGHALFSSVKETEEAYEVALYSNLDNLIWHWGLGLARSKEWVPATTIAALTPPARTVQFDSKACQTPFQALDSELVSLSLQIPKSLTPKQINFVLKQEDTWFNNDNNDYAIALFHQPRIGISDGAVGQMVDQIVEVETNGNSWTLMHRFNMCDGLLKRVKGSEALAWVFIWMRYSALGLITWQRKFNTKPSNLAHSQKNLTYTLVEMIKTASAQGLVSPLMLLRGVLSGIGRGGDHGQKIRDQILVIMHKHHIKEHENFYEQWHQKLHNNTTPDDIGICEAIIVFNETNDLNRFWDVLTEHGISKERLASFERPITMLPFYAPQIIGDLKDYLQLLKSVHQAADLQTSVERAKQLFDAELAAAVDAVMSGLRHWDKLQQFARAVTARKALKRALNRENTYELRELLYVDLALESYSKSVIEQVIHLDIGMKHLFTELLLLLESIGLHTKEAGLEAATVDIQKFYEAYGDSYESNREHALILKSGIDRLSIVIGNFVDEYIELIESKAKYLGSQFEVEDFYANMFAEELIRGTPVSMLSLLIKRINKTLRVVAGLKPWQIISPQSEVQGLLLAVETLSEVAYTKYSQPTILIAKKVSGDEEVPQGVVGVISKTDLDTLAHVSVRARNTKTFLAVCYDETELHSAELLIERWVSLRFHTGGVSIIETAKTTGKHTEVQKPHGGRNIPQPEALQKTIISMEEFSDHNVGAKAKNCAILVKTLPSSVLVPQSVALPYGCCEHFLEFPVNAEAQAKLRRLLGEFEGIHDQQAQGHLELMRATVMSLGAPAEAAEELKTGLAVVGLAQGA